MKKNTFYLFLLLLSASLVGRAQELSSLSVKYMVSYDDSDKTYTAWVVPDYDTPNANNATSEERGVTAQFTVKVPKGFVINNLRDIKGAWDKQPAKIGGSPAFVQAGADAASEYYVIGKAPTETNFGTFRQDEPVALFSFSGTGGDPKSVKVLEVNDPFIKLADDRFALNVGNSFYSRSGQYRSMMAAPLEQFSLPTTIQNVLTEIAKKGNVDLLSPGVMSSQDMQLIAFPNPVQHQLTVKYFSLKPLGDVKIEVVTMEGQVRESFKLQADYGVNTLKMDVRSLQEGVYLVRTKVNDEIVNKKVLKVK